MSKEQFSIMKEVHDLIDRLQKENDETSIVFFAVEFDKSGFPFSKSCKISGNPAQSLAGLDMIERAVKEQKDDVHSKLDMASNMSDKLDEVISKMGFDGIDDPKFHDFLTSNDSDTSKQLRQMIVDLKKRFGR
jgi:hypothetical protein